ncbi:MAG: HAD-IIIA family hydrolase [Solirubrobacterales bacterium]|nr:HAD-IIIA family hydrolase [Solirubrobacterales bacterium]MBV9363209.1 HAD-IIIA family hydrolase [Solirubrobacterales bacterium]MBV9681687.1 HAD-IIIA family hydrolase [Solirubrobacterales bacterium]MBV9809271.1 HAD-IIIA family hydrolase [Solirubrobacterales bacterium]
MSRPAAFLDRDGVLNRPIIRSGRPYPPESVAELSVLPGVVDACREMCAAGLTLVCVTNQPDIARGTQDRATVSAINDRLRELLALHEVVICPHDDEDGCLCRKPLPGMILDAARRHDLDVSHSVTVGDRWRDVEAGRAAGTWTVFIDRGYDERPPVHPDLTVKELEEAIPWIIDKAHSLS